MLNIINYSQPNMSSLPNPQESSDLILNYTTILKGSQEVPIPKKLFN